MHIMNKQNCQITVFLLSTNTNFLGVIHTKQGPSEMLTIP